MPFVARSNLAGLGGVGWVKGILLTLTGGPPLALFSYAGFLFVPLAHGAVIQPSCAAVGGLMLATFVLREKLPAGRAIGAAIIVAGLAVIGAEALTTLGSHGLVGDLSFVTAGLLFATFGMLLRLWRIAPTRAVAVTSVVSLVGLPLHWMLFGFERMISLGLVENLVQLVAQGVFAGAGATYFFTRSVVLLGAGRAAVFPSLVPGFTLLIGFLVLGGSPDNGAASRLCDRADRVPADPDAMKVFRALCERPAEHLAGLDVTVDELNHVASREHYRPTSPRCPSMDTR